MLNENKSRAVRLLLACLVFCSLGCAGNTPAAPEPRSQANGEYFLFLSAAQGNPVCVFVSVQKKRVSGLMSSPRTKWQAHAWLVVPGASRYLFSESGKGKMNPELPLHWANEALLFTTEKERFVFYKPFRLDKLLFLSESIYADRVRKSEEQEIRYGLVASSLLWNNRRMEGKLFYETRDLVSSAAPGKFLPLTGAPRGGTVYALWAPDGAFLFLEKTGGDGSKSDGCLAILQDRRGRWDETFAAEVQEPACAFSASPCSGEEGVFRVRVPLWRLEGSLGVLQEAKPGPGGQAEKPGPAPEVVPEENLLWASLGSLQQERQPSTVKFCLLRGDLLQGEETRTVYGVGMTTE